MSQKAFILDLNKCTGCQACELACNIENQLDSGKSWRRIETFNSSRHPDFPLYHLSLACHHCIDPPCMKCCPAGVYDKDSVTGIVNLDRELCIGCKYCSWICPFDAPHFNPNGGFMEKCTFCSPRLEDGDQPACVTACPTGALQTGEYETSGGVTEIGRFPDTPFHPAIRFLPFRQSQRATGTLDKGADLVAISPTPSGSNPGISLESEWPLLLFTLITPFLVAQTISRNEFGSFVFTAVGLIGVLISLMHLGKPPRFWRAFLNWRYSWLSREIILFSVFFTIAIVSQNLGEIGVLHWITATLGILTLIAMDRVYHFPGSSLSEWHSASTLMICGFLTLLFLELYWAFYTVALLRACLYGFRKLVAFRSGKPSRAILSFFRIGVGILLPISIGPFSLAGFMLIVAGEIIDRSEFFLELRACSTEN